MLQVEFRSFDYSKDFSTIVKPKKDKTMNKNIIKNLASIRDSLNKIVEGILSPECICVFAILMLLVVSISMPNIIKNLDLLFNESDERSRNGN